MTLSLSRVLMMIVLSLALLSGLLSAAGADTGTKHKFLFAVIPDVPSSANLCDNWLPVGVSFDLEKRLSRVPSLEAADRLDVKAVLGKAATGDEESKVRAVTQAGVETVMCVGALAKGAEVTLTCNVWSRGQRIASVARTGAPADIFRLDDGIVDDVLAELAKAEVEIVKPDAVPELKWYPARSVSAYQDLICGMILLQRGDLLHAEPRLLKTLSAEPDNWFAHYFLGAVMLYRGDIAKAAQYCREAISINPDFYPGVYANLSYCCAAMGKDKEATWAKMEFERRAGKPLPPRTVPGGMPPETFGMRP